MHFHLSIFRAHYFLCNPIKVQFSYSSKVQIRKHAVIWRKTMQKEEKINFPSAQFLFTMNILFESSPLKFRRASFLPFLQQYIAWCDEFNCSMIRAPFHVHDSFACVLLYKKYPEINYAKPRARYDDWFVITFVLYIPNFAMFFFIIWK